MDLRGVTRVPSSESVAAELRRVVCPAGLVPASLAARAGELVELSRLDCVRSRMRGPDTVDLARAVVVVVKAAVTRLSPGPGREATELLLGLGRTRGLLRKDRRRIAAAVLDVGREHFRKNRELPLLLEVAEELRALEVEHARGGGLTSRTSAQAGGPLLDGDDVRFVADATIPDGTTVRVGQRFVKTWEIRNSGSVEWINRYLRRLGPSDAEGLCHSPARVPIPRTPPGAPVRISVPFTAPALPGSCRADWMIVDETGRYFFPNKHSLYVIVHVVD